MSLFELKEMKKNSRFDWYYGKNYLNNIMNYKYTFNLVLIRMNIN